ncbi:MAG: cobalamin-independent methionine synthase II family protein [Candidatus Latescibacteria bacterium]|nr:cobalamin-independent methionine synthase II family protein [Candidatus Latescibacterota bacterium]
MSHRILATVVGSYPVPDWLQASPSRQALIDAIRVVFKTQEDAGIDVVTDGELYRFDANHPETNGMIDYFARRLGGITTRFGREDLNAFRTDAGLSYRADPAGMIERELDEGTLNLPRDYRMVRHLTRSRLKFTLTGPHMLSKVLLDRHYGDPAAVALTLGELLARQVADINADVIQIDEANIPGHPEEAPWAARALNTVLDAVKGEKAVHVCFGNYGGQTVQQGTWQDLVPYLAALRADHLVLEFKRWGIEHAACLKDVPDSVQIGIGVIDIKTNVVETPDEIASDIEAAASHLGPDRIACVHPDCGFWMLQRSVADRKIEALVRGRDLFEGR